MQVTMKNGTLPCRKCGKNIATEGAKGVFIKASLVPDFPLSDIPEENREGAMVPFCTPCGEAQEKANALSTAAKA